jgi:hypothetical protein
MPVIGSGRRAAAHVRMVTATIRLSGVCFPARRSCTRGMMWKTPLDNGADACRDKGHWRHITVILFSVHSFPLV